MKTVLNILLLVSAISISFAQNCQLKKEQEYDPSDGTILKTTTYNYDKTGLLLSWTDSSDYLVNYSAEYNATGRLHSYSEGADGFIYFIHQYNYSEDKISEIHHYNDLNMLIAISRYVYDKQKRLKKIIELDTQSPDTLVVSQETYYYENDAARNPYKKFEEYDGMMNEFRLKYDNNKNPYAFINKLLGHHEENNLLSFIFVDEQGNEVMEKSTLYTYSFNKNKLPETVTVADGLNNIEYAYRYFYDCK
ncbi:MAG: hypothetical protein POELPBGB_02304 [Bacteroidia bacterium]|nr:hypothetical protein [Bacteroidia bacterium]